MSLTLALASAALIGSAVVSAQSFTSVSFPALASHIGFDSGVSWVDFDGDGDLDLSVVTTSPISRPNRLYRNDGGTFVDVPDAAPVLDDAETNSQAWADVDDDGDVDLFLANFANRGNQFVRNLGAGSFAFEGGLPFIADSLRGRGCAWGDYDRDGRVDLVVTARSGYGGIQTPNLLFRNLGDATFARIDTGAVVAALGTWWTPVWCDWDLDGDLDLAIASDPGGINGPDRFYLNRLVETGIAWFQPWNAGLLTQEPRQSQVIRWIDYDNDGDFDVFITNAGDRANELFRNDNGVYAKVLSGPLVIDGGTSRGCAWGDFDNDGDLDVYVARDAEQPNRYYRNDGAGVFTRITAGPFVNDARSDWGAAAGDYDRDGDLDLFTTSMFTGPSVLYRNDLVPGSHWLEVQLVGGPSNRSGIGARVRACARIGGQTRWQLREISTQTSFGGHDALEAHFGLGDAGVVDTLRIEWPSGAVDTWVGLPADTVLVMAEGQGTVGVAPADERAPGIRGLTVAPNPTLRRFAVRFELRQSSEVEWEVLDLAGRKWAGRSLGTFGAGAHTVHAEIGDEAPPGIYFATVRAGIHRAVVRFVRRR